MKRNILAVDDEPELLSLVAFNLEQAGFKVSTARDGEAGLRKARDLKPSLVLLDIMLPKMDGLEVFKILRNDPAMALIPVVFLTARSGEMDRIVGLELGAADYITKPFSPRELVLRVRKAIQRAESFSSNDTIALGPLAIDVPGHMVFVQGRQIELTITEFRLLEYLTKSTPRVQSREQLLQVIGGYGEGAHTRTVDTHMRRLRVKLGSAASHLHTVRGIGYRFMHEQD